MMALIDFVLHFDKHLLEFVGNYGSWVYAILFAIVFVETGFVVTPFLPGDSLLFAAGALCATGKLSTPILFGLLVVRRLRGQYGQLVVGRLHRPARVRGRRHWRSRIGCSIGNT